MATIQQLVSGFNAGNIGYEDGARRVFDQANVRGLNWDDLAHETGLDIGVLTDVSRDLGLSLNPYGLQASRNSITTATNRGAEAMLTGYEHAGKHIGGGVTDAMSTLGNYGGQATQAINTGIDYLNPYAESGQQANQLQMAFSGALGPEAQAQAFENYRNSPGVDFMVGEGERAITRNAAATGGGQGGNVMRELMRFGTGVAMQDFGNQYDRLQGLSTQGLNARMTQAGMRGQEANIATSLGTTGAGIQAQGGLSMGGIASNLASQAGGMFQNAGFRVGQDQMQTGRDVSGVIRDTSSALATLAERDGAAQSDTLGKGANNIATLIDRAYGGDARAMEELGVVLANLGISESSQFGSQPIVGFEDPNTLATLGQVASGLGGLYGNLPSSNGGTTSNPTNNPTIDWDQFSQWINAGAPT